MADEQQQQPAEKPNLITGITGGENLATSPVVHSATSSVGTGEAGSQILWSTILQKVPPDLALSARGFHRIKETKALEARVQEETIAVAKEALFRSLVIMELYGKDSMPDFVSETSRILLNKDFLRSIGYSRDQLENIADQQQRLQTYQQVVERFFEKNQDAAIILGVYFSAQEWQLIKGAFTVNKNSIEGKEVKPLEPKYTLGRRRLIINPDGTIKAEAELSHLQTYE